MEMSCPYCDISGGLMDTHRHLVDMHLDQVTMRREGESGKMVFILECPFCDLDARREVNPRGRNPRFLEEFHLEIAMVAFDQLLYHILQDHPQQVGVNPAALGWTDNLTDIEERTR